MDRSWPGALTRAAVPVLGAVGVTALLALLRAAPPVEPDALGLGWTVMLVEVFLAAIASTTAVLALATGLRHGTLAALLGGGAAAAIAGGVLVRLAGGASLATTAMGGAALLVGAAAAARFELGVPGRLGRVGVAVGVVVAVEALALASVLAGRGAVAGLEGPLLTLALGLSLGAALLSAGQRLMPVTLGAAVGAAGLLLARGDSLELVAGMVAMALALVAAVPLLLAARSVELVTTESLLPALAAHVSEGVLRFDGRLRLVDWNEPAATILGLQATSAGTRLEDLLGTSLADLPPADGSQAVRGTVDGIGITLHRATDGVVAVIAEPAPSPEAERLGRELRGTIQELIEARRTIDLQRAEIDRASTVDALTGVTSRASIVERLRIEAAQAARYQHPVAVVLLDIDEFVGLNRQHGIGGGDRILREVALRIRLRVRAADAIGRYGSDGFLAILPHTDEAGAATFADALRRRLASRPISLGEEHVEVTVSAGVAVMRPGEELDADGLLARAEEALESARRAGGDRIALDRLHGLARLETHLPQDPEGDETTQDRGS
jgi:diguanylate cyclase (GGDEF)-like protein